MSRPSGPPPPLHESLLHAAPTPSERAPDRRWAYSLTGIVCASVFVLYHVAVLLVWNTPGVDLAKRFHSSFLTAVRGSEYFRGTRNDQSWAMFAPNPDRTNNFIQVFVIDEAGEIWDFGQDIWAEDRYPYLWYDRRGKVNRNLDGKKNYQRIYGAWVCREWERQRGGERARAVRFVKRWTKVPEPAAVIERGGWDQWAAPYQEWEQETVICRTVTHGTLPNELRRRHGLAPIDEAREFRPVELRTWWDERHP